MGRGVCEGEGEGESKRTVKSKDGSNCDVEGACRGSIPKQRSREWVAAVERRVGVPLEGGDRMDRERQNHHARLHGTRRPPQRPEGPLSAPRARGEQCREEGGQREAGGVQYAVHHRQARR